MALYDEFYGILNKKTQIRKQIEEEEKKKREKEVEKKPDYKLPTRKAYGSDSKNILAYNKERAILPIQEKFQNQLKNNKRVEVPQEDTFSSFINKASKETMPIIRRSVLNEGKNVIGNVGSGIGNGLIHMQQTFDRTVKKQQEKDIQSHDYWNKKMAEGTGNKEYSAFEDTSKKILGKNHDKPLLPIATTLEKQKQINNEKIQRNIENSNTSVGKKLAELAPSIGQMIPGMIPGIAPIYFTGSATGSHYDEAKKRGMSEEEADKYGTAMGLAEGLTEMLPVKKLFKGGKLVSKGAIPQALKELGKGAIENAVQEAVIEPLGELTAKAVGGDKYLKNDYTTPEGWGQLGKDMLSSGIDGALTSIIMGGASAGIGSSVNIVDKISNGKNITTSELNVAKQDVQSRMTDKQVQDKLQEAQEIISRVQKEQNSGNKAIRVPMQENILQQDKMLQNQNMEQEKLQNNKLYFRFDNKNGFKGKDHESGVSMWEERVEKLLTPNYDAYGENVTMEQMEFADEKVDEILQKYGTTLEKYESITDNQKQEIKREIAKDEGYITKGASAFELNEDGIDELIKYISNGHPLSDYEEVNFFTGERNGLGADRENVIVPNETIYTGKTKEIFDIVDNNQLTSSQKKGKILDLINGIVYNDSESESGINGAVISRYNEDDGRGVRRFPTDKTGIQDGTRTIDRLSTENEKTSKLTNQERKIEIIDYAEKNRKQTFNQTENQINNIAQKLGADVIFYDKNDLDYSGFTKENKIYIDTSSGERTEVVFAHELLHWSRINGNKVYEKEIAPIVNKMATYDEYQDTIFNFAQKANLSIEDLSENRKARIAEEILADYTANILANYNTDYGLDSKTLNDLRRAVLNISNKILPTQRWLDEHKIDYEVDEKGEVVTDQNEVSRIYNLEDQENNAEENNIEEQVESSEKRGRRDVIKKNRELAREKTKNIATWKDKTMGIKYQRETMERNMFDIIPNKEEAQDIVNTYFEPIHKSEAEKQKYINYYNEKIKALNLNEHESEAVQLLGEKKYNPDFKESNALEVLYRINENIENGKVDKTKVDNAIEVFRNIYDEIYEAVNKTLRENGYPEIPYRKGYFPHFLDVELETRTEQVLDKLGFKIDKRSLPTSIAGITEQFVPGRTWNKSSLARKTDKTTYNVLKGFDAYIAQASDNIFHTENIQKLRALENEIRYQYSDKGVQKRFNEIYNDEALKQDEKQDRIDSLFKQVHNPMPNLVVELRRYTNALANKNSEADRGIERRNGRPIYAVVSAIQNRFGANAVGLNIGSAITNFIPITQAYSQVGAPNMGRATIDTIKSYIEDDGFVSKSTFLTNRLNKSEKLYKTTLEKISDKTSFLFNAIDSVTSNIVVRSKYLENIKNGMNEIDAIKNADRFGANVIADRSKGALPTLFEEKNPLTKIFTQFQLEVNNQYSYMFKDVPRDLKEKGMGGIALAFFKMFVASWIYNIASEKLTGRKPAFSPIDIAVSGYKTMSDPKMKTADKLISIGKDVVEEVPFAGSLLGGGRIPVSGALPDPGNTFKSVVGLATGEMDSNKALSNIGKEIAKSSFYLLPPFGGGQIKKTIEGISTVSNGGSYGIDSEGKEILQFPVENASSADYLKAGIFGKYALPLAKDYSDSGFKSLNAKETEGYKKSNVPYKEFITYANNTFKKKEDKISFVNSMKLNQEQKWDMYSFDIFNNEIRESDGGSQLKDAQYAISKGISKEEYINLFNKAYRANIDMPTQKEQRELKDNNVTMGTYITYKLDIKELSNNLKQSEDKIKNKDKINVLLKSNYSDKEKVGIYSNYINKKDTQYKVLKEAKISIDEYLRYKAQEFESDKKDDGTTKGKTISNSKKKKEITYINSMNISYEQKLMLAGMNYSLPKNQKSILANYINNLKISKLEKMKIYEKYSNNFKVYKDGRIKW